MLWIPPSNRDRDRGRARLRRDWGRDKEMCGEQNPVGKQEEL